MKLNSMNMGPDCLKQINFTVHNTRITYMYMFSTTYTFNRKRLSFIRFPLPGAKDSNW